MTLYQWFIFFLIIQIVHFIGTWKLYEKAGRKSWEAAIPVYNAIVLMKIINRPSWWTILLFVPVINLIMFPVVWVETIRSFGKKTTLDTVLVLFTLGLYIYYINYTQDVTHIKDRSLVSPTKTGDTISSFLFAIIVATLVHTYVMQPFTIPSSSLEKTLLIGDFLFVSKFHYGARTPMTTVAAPMVHDTIPIINIKSYLYDDNEETAKTSWKNKLQLPYFRFPGFEKIEKNDIVVFNWPADTLYNMYKPADRRYCKPVDKRTNYVKRCVGTPGDSLSVRNGVVFIDGKELILSDRAKPQYSYDAKTDGTELDRTYLLKELNITDGFGYIKADSVRFFALTEENMQRLKNNPSIKSIKRNISEQEDPSIFPFTKKWNLDNLGPIYIPEAGKTVTLNRESIAFYKKVIGEYEGNDLKINGDEIRINGQIAKSYTFKQDYYYMMGDNRHNSLDSRFWGFVPADHIVGKPVFIWMSLDQNIGWNKAIDKIRWDRMFTTVGGDGEPYSYFKFFLIALVAYFGISYFMKKKRAKS
ncbi:signal peptidase I [Flavobacterium arsenatis]|uniref:Signal peptidase I n=1 Tax=Flavobacterium arsenatis TaxID=1484332 RepID=A0ABU1TSN3_9FLAO|nr:signal peptidase I [Flavobacterium arsenatis]MDR6968861.1 signal peptidase I [Flavobacterium arsenatis]